MKELDEFYWSKPEPLRGCLLLLRSIILSQDQRVSETRKYGMPCFCYNKKAYCYLWIDKHTGEPYILMVEGKYLHQIELITGNRSRMKILPIDSNKDLPLQLIEEILNEALDLYRKGVLKS